MIPTIDHKEEVRPGQSITQTVIDGVNVFAFNVKPGDVQSWDKSEGNRGPNGQFNERAEISYAPAQGTLKGNSPYDVRDTTGRQNYDLAYRFKAGFPPHDAAKHEWAMITQFHVQDNNPSGFKGFNGVSVHSGRITLETPGQNGVYFVQEPIVTDKWLKRRLEVNWSSKLDGYVRWIDRDSGALIGSYQGPTIAAGEYKYILQGYYRAGGLPEATIYQTQIDINPESSALIPPAPAPAPVSGPSPDDQIVLKKALAVIAALPAQITTLQGILDKIQTDVQAILDKGPSPWPK